MTNPKIQEKLHTYPPLAQQKLLELRTLIIESIESNDLGDVEETLKWNEPSYLVKGGSTIRIDWKPKTPDQYSMFFNCNTKLVDTYRELYADVLSFEGNRAIVLNLNEPLPIDAIRHCIELALRYKSIRHLPLLGA